MTVVVVCQWSRWCVQTGPSQRARGYTAGAGFAVLTRWLHSLPSDLELEFTSRREPQRPAHCWSGMVYSHSSTSHRPLFLLAFWVVIGELLSDCSGLPFVLQFFTSVLGLAGYFSCVNEMFLSDTCENARLWAFVSSAVLLRSQQSISVSQSLQSAVVSKEVLLQWFLTLNSF